MRTSVGCVIVFIVAFFMGVTEGGNAQVKTVGLFVNDTAKSWKGYTLFAPKHFTSTYLIDNAGKVVHTWTGCLYEPGQSVYLLENGHLLRSCMTKGPLSTGGGEGGRIEEYDWDSNLVWEFDYSSTTYMQHHDIRPLPNGNILILAVEKKTLADLTAAGFNAANYQADVTTKGYMVPEYVVEVAPVRPKGGTVVWEWHVWDHLIQDNDAAKSNYGVVSQHPELIDVDGDGKKLPSFWNHANSVNYHPGFDQIMISARNNSEVWVIDHSTSTAQAAGHTGGKGGKGGDLLYRWGNPVCYGSGTSANQQLYQQHDAQWVPSGYPGAGNIMVFNNGLGRNYSTADEFTPPVDSNGVYSRTNGAAFGPAGLTWSFAATPATDLFSEAISGVQRLPNGNTLIDDGVHGTFLEVTSGGEVVWKYVNPVVGTGPLAQYATIPDDPARAGEKMNGVFRVTRYAPTFAGLLGRDLTPRGTIETYPTGVIGDGSTMPGQFTLCQNYPNPFNPATVIRYSLPAAGHVVLVLHDILGKEVVRLVDAVQSAGVQEVNLDADRLQLASGVYLYSLHFHGRRQTKMMSLVR
jgi:hypothetical protein